MNDQRQVHVLSRDASRRRAEIKTDAERAAREDGVMLVFASDVLALLADADALSPVIDFLIRAEHAQGCGFEDGYAVPCSCGLTDAREAAAPLRAGLTWRNDASREGTGTRVDPSRSSPDDSARTPTRN